jgi:hypothetical protein
VGSYGRVLRKSVGGKEGKDLGFGEVETQGFQGDFEFVVVYSLVFIEVEKSELLPFELIPSFPPNSN